MPNHCCNKLILPDEESLQIIIKNYIKENENGNNYFDFESIIPIGEIHDWYDQRIEKWGTKWNGYDLFICEDFIEFYTAWAPPIGIIERLAELHKDFIFQLEYHEGGIGFRGVAIAKWQDGEVLLDDQCWDMTDEDLIELGLIDESQEEQKQIAKLRIPNLFYWLKQKLLKLLKGNKI